VEVRGDGDIFDIAGTAAVATATEATGQRRRCKDTGKNFRSTEIGPESAALRWQSSILNTTNHTESGLEKPSFLKFSFRLFLRF